jgi:hypothetical protein
MGAYGNWNQTELLPSNKNNKEIKFPAESLVEIEMEGPVIGDLRKLKIWHTAKSIKDGWYLSYVEVNCPKLKQSWKFVCDKWLSKNRPPEYKNSAVLFSNELISLPNSVGIYYDLLLLIYFLLKQFYFYRIYISYKNF